MGRPAVEPCACRYCGRPARYPVLALCEAHHARMKRGADMTAPLREYHAGAFDRLLAAALACAEAESADAWSNAKARLIQSAKAYVAREAA